MADSKLKKTSVALPPDIWRRTKSEAASRGMLLAEALVDALTPWLNRTRRSSSGTVRRFRFARRAV